MSSFGAATMSSRSISSCASVSESTRLSNIFSTARFQMPSCTSMMLFEIMVEILLARVYANGANSGMAGVATLSIQEAWK